MYFKKNKIIKKDVYENITPIILKDSHGIIFVLNEYERPYMQSRIERTCDDEVFAAYELLLNDGDVVFDVGAHIGRYSVFPSKLISENGHVYSFEPVYENYWQLKTTLSLNRCENVTAVKKALIDKICKMEIHLFDKEFSSWSSLGNHEMVTPDGKKVKPHRTEIVQCDTIDNFCLESSIGRINFLKIDVEGFELHVLKGAEKMLEAHLIDYICFEVSEMPLGALGVSASQLVGFLDVCGYKVFKLEGPPYKYIGPITDLNCFHGNYYASFHDLSAMISKGKE